MKVLLCLFAMFITGCIRQPLTVYTDYVNKEDLASSHVETPDPQQNCPDIGQRLVIFWALPWKFKNRNDLYLQYSVRLRDHTEISERLHLIRKSGYECYFVKNEDFFQSGGIATFKVAVFGSEGVIYEWIHPLWVDLIEIGNSN